MAEMEKNKLTIQIKEEKEKDTPNEFHIKLYQTKINKIAEVNKVEIDMVKLEESDSEDKASKAKELKSKIREVQVKYRL